MYCLIQNPEVMARVKTEVKSNLAENVAPTPSDLSKLKYLGNTLRETLRLYPSVPSTGYVKFLSNSNNVGDLHGPMTFFLMAHL